MKNNKTLILTTVLCLLPILLGLALYDQLQRFSRSYCKAPSRGSIK